MVYLRVTLNRFLIALAVIYATSLPLAADEVEDLLAQLRAAEASEGARLVDEIYARWSQSGSPAMDFLLMRGREAMEAGDLRAAVEHLTALTDHAPEFAEGWNARATAFFLQERYGEAVHDIEQVLALNPNHFGAMSGLGLILEQIGYPKDALRALRAAADLNPSDVDIQGAIARLEREVGGASL